MIKNGVMDTSNIDAKIADIISEEDMKMACMFNSTLPHANQGQY